MLTAFSPNHAAESPECFHTQVVEGTGALPERTLWLDLQSPTPAEDVLAEAYLGIAVPTRDEMEEIEPSSLLYVEDGARYVTARLLCSSDTASPKLTPVSFILTDKALVTVRYDEPKSFALFKSRLKKSGTCPFHPEAVLDGLFEAVVDRAAEVLRKLGTEMEATSQSVFVSQAATRDRGAGLSQVIRDLGRHADLISNVQDSMLSLERAILFLIANTAAGKKAAYQPQLKAALRDVQAIEQHAQTLSGKIQFVLDATLGMVSLEQNRIVKIFSVLAVIFMPPTLVASIYGMNFRKGMPELDWAYGYPFALGMMLIAAVLPYLFFRWKKWL
jgi:magnesium transporter